ncbi:TraB/GumN family protein [Undibacterium sp.]|uniref:TraB/GumN family protein n=1 Tax=Undibacterium sp. TaxID=1914977 RepID=UPI0025CDB3E4|nr:TraB/GumN family protein [Undibacterium sp.]
MKYLSIFVFCLFFYASTDAPASEDAKEITPILEIKKNNKTVAYVIGVMHQFPKNSGSLASEKVKNLISKSAGLVTELGLNQFVFGEDAIEDAMENARGGRALSSVIPVELFNLIEDKLTPIYGENTHRLLEESHPLKAGNVLLALCPVEMNKHSTEAELIMIAAAADLPILSIESVAEQVESFPPYEASLWHSYLASILNYINIPNCAELHRDSLRRLAYAALSGNLSLLENALNDSYGTLNLKEFDDYSMVQRNKRMTKRILKLAESKKVFVFAVGARHLPGPQGILAQLKLHKYTIKQIETQP